MSIRIVLANILVLLFFPVQLTAAPEAEELAALQQPFTVEYYYRVKWGHEEEFIDLYKRNHWPLIVADMERGEILDFKLDRTRMSGAESHRWEIRATITFRNILLPHGMVDRTREPVIARLFPDRERWELEEKRRFELCDSIMSVEVEQMNLQEWPTTGQH